jgi:hypothetical protein
MAEGHRGKQLVFISNITPDPETGIGRWSDAERFRAIREGAAARRQSDWTRNALPVLSRFG